jgi:intein-encoded DNA endonuclease-like protein
VGRVSALYVRDQKTRERIRELHETGLSYYQIATQLREETGWKVTPNIVFGTLKVMGVKR